MSRTPSLDQLWARASASGLKFDPAALAGLPDMARRYLEHAIAPGTPLASAVRLKMRGEIKLREWLPFTAEEVLCWNCGMIWKARVSMKGLPIVGSDSLVDGKGEMRWKLLGLIPMMTASGPDISRSTIGRAAAEALWLPSVLCDKGVLWSRIGPSRIRADYTGFGQAHQLSLDLNETGAPVSLVLPRWGDPDKKGFRYNDFGGILEGEKTFGGYTIPTRLRLGWYFGTERFEPEGEFFRATVESAEFR